MKKTFLQPKNISLKKRITTEELKFNLKHLKQVVFELTERCNLACKYCTYGKYYVIAPERKLYDIKWEYIKNVIDYVYDIKDSGSEIDIGFYGGEPLLKFNLIKKTVTYCNEINRKNILFTFGMTINAILMDKYAEFIAKNNFNLLISIDGDRYANSFRIFHNGKESFDVVFSNIKKLKEQFPEYFKKNVNFNSVLHQRNKIPEINKFIKEHFNKTPMIASLALDNISPLYEKEFINELYKNYNSDFENLKSMKVIEGQVKQNAYLSDLLRLLSNRNPLFVSDYNELLNNELYPKTQVEYIPTATCIPLVDKIFITVQGKILPCERINHKYSFGFVTENKVDINFEYIANRYNAYYDKMEMVCNACFYKDN